MGARQYTQHLQVHKTWEPDNTASSASQKNGSQTGNTHTHTHTIFNTINSITRSGSQTVKTQSIFSNTRTRCQTFGYEVSSPSVDLRLYFHCSHVALERLPEQHASLLSLFVTYIDLLATRKPPTSDRHLHRSFGNTQTAYF